MPPEIDLARRSHAMLVRAMEVEAPARRAFVARECAGDPELLARMLSLLDASDRSERFLDRPALEGERGRPVQIPDAVGDYLIVGVLGVGGMATVYEAIQEHPRRRVALKVLHQSVTQSEAYARFRFETEALARLHHPGIAQIYEAGAAQLGQPAPAPFFAMELIPRALPITDYATKRGLTVRERIEMVASVCDAVHHGHQHGIIHRDLKPANVLVDGDGRAKVIDFGVARAADAGAESPTSTLGVPQIVGTLSYMSPEQCGAGEIDSRTDVYSLGVMLYELVCGRLPHKTGDLPLPAALHAIINEPPAPPALPRARANRDLEAIILKAIERDPARRYDSASALASDLRRFLEHQPIDARPPGLWDQCRHIARQHRGIAAAAVAGVVSVALIAGISTVFALRLAEEVRGRRRAEARAMQERDAARWQAYTSHIAGALAAMKTGEFRQMRARLEAASFRSGGWEWGFLSRLADPSASTVPAHDDMIMDMAVSPDRERLATAAGDGTISLWAVDGATPLATLPSPTGARAHAAAFTPDGLRLIAGDADGVVRLLDASDLHEVAVLARMPAQVMSVVALADDRFGAASLDGTAVVGRLDEDSVVSLSEDQPGGVHGLAVSADGSTLATYNNAGRVWVRRASDMSVTRQLQFPGSVNQARFSPDGRFLGAVGGSTRVLVWSLEDGSLRRELQATVGVNTVRSLAFSGDGGVLAAGLTHRGIVVFSTEDGGIVGELGGHAEAVSSLHFRADDQLLVSASWDGTIRTWRTSEIEGAGGTVWLKGHEDHVFAADFSPDGSMVASVSSDGSLRLWDPVLEAPIARLVPTGSALAAVAYSPDGELIAAAGSGDEVVVLSASTGAVISRLPGHGRGVAALAFDASGRRLAAGGQDGLVRIWNIQTRQQERLLGGHRGRVNSVRFSPDGALVASGSRDRTVRLWDAGTGEELRLLTDHGLDVFAVLFSADGRRLYSGSRDQTVRVWDVPSGECIETLADHGQYVTSLALSPDGTRLAAGSWFGEIVLFDVETLDMIASFRAHDSAIRGVAFSPDGRWLASASYDATVRLFDSATRLTSDATREQAIASQDAARAAVAPFLERSSGNRVAAEGMLLDAGLDPGADPWIRKALLSGVELREER